MSAEWEDREDPVEVVEIRLSGEIELPNDVLSSECAAVVVWFAGRPYVPARPESIDAARQDGSRSMRRALQLARELGRTPLLLVVHPSHEPTARVVAIEEGVRLELDPSLPVGGPRAIRVGWEGYELQELPPAEDPSDEPWRAP